MVDHFKTKSFRKLNDEWAKKLKESGFEDIEYPYSDSLFKKKLRTKKLKRFREVQDYYLLASHYLFEGKFKDERDKKIWELHSEGKSLSEIGVEINLSKSSVGYHLDIIRADVRTFYKCKRRLVLL